MRGTPAFGFTHSGRSPATASNSATIASVSASDLPQFAPIAATPSDANASTTWVGVRPIIVRVPWSKL